MMHHPFKHAFIFAVALALCTVISAQNITISGKVLDKHDNKGIPFCNLALLSYADSTFIKGISTGEDGSFLLKDIQPNTYLLRTSYVGYTTSYLTLNEGDNLTNLVILLSAGNTLQEVSIADKRPLYLVDGEKTLYNTAEDPSVQSGSLSDALQNAPGIEVDADGSITLRGSTSVELWINGRPTHLTEEAQKQYIRQIPASQIKTIEVITNPSMRYSSSGPVVNIVLNNKRFDNNYLSIGANAQTTPSIQPWLSYVYMKGKVELTTYFGYTWGYYDQYNEGSSSLYTTDNTLANHMEFSADSRIRLAALYGNTTFNYTIDSSSNISTHLSFMPMTQTSKTSSRYLWRQYLLPDSVYDCDRITNSRVNFLYSDFGTTYEKRFNNEGKRLQVSLNATLPINKDTSYILSDYDSVVPMVALRHKESHERRTDVSMSVLYATPFVYNINLEMGIDGIYSPRNNYRYVDTLNHSSNTFAREQERSFTCTNTIFTFDPFLTLSKQFGSLNVKLGLRGNGQYDDLAIDSYDHFTANTSHFNMQYSLHASYTTPTFHNFSFSYTHRNHNVAAQSLVLYHNYDDEGFTTGNPNLKNGYGENIEASWSKYIDKIGNIQIEGYYYANHDDIGTISDVVFSDYHGRWVVYSTDMNIGTSKQYGINASFMFRPTAMLNLMCMASLFNNSYSGDMHGIKIDHDLWTYSLRARLWTKLWDKLELFGNIYYRSTGAEFLSEMFPYKSFDIGASTTLLEDRLSLYFKVNDLFNWSQWGEKSTNPSLLKEMTTSFAARYISLGATLRFGQMAMKDHAREGAFNGGSQIQ